MNYYLPQFLRLALCIALMAGVENASAQRLASHQTAYLPGPNQQDARQPLHEALEKLGQQHQVRFSFDRKLVEEKFVKEDDIFSRDLYETLDRVLTPLQLKYEKIDAVHFVIVPKKEASRTIERLDKKAVRTSHSTSTVVPSVIPYSPLSTHHATTSVEKTITGRVTDLSTNEGLPGVNIVVKNTTIGTVTDIDGNYRLTAPDDAETLVFSSVGYTSEEVAIGNQTVINLEMAPDIQSLSEIVVVGYGTQRRADLTGSIASVAPEEIARVPVATLQQSLQGQAAGVEVTSNNGAPGQGAVVRIRGVGSTGNTNPLYVVDGVPVSDPNLVNPLDIASIQVLKDASASAIYGSRGANGVIIITTKRGESGEPKFSLDAYYGLQSAWRTVEMANNQEYAELVKELNENGIAEGISGASVPETAENILANPAQYGEGTDWTDAIFRTAPIQNYNLSVSGGSDYLKYNVSGGYLRQDGIIIETAFERYNFRLNTDLTRGRFRLAQSLSLVQSWRDAERGGRNALERIATITPSVPVYDRTQLGGFAGPVAADEHDAQNPVGEAVMTNNEITNREVLGNLSGEYEIIEGLTYKLNLGLNYGFRDNFNHRQGWIMGDFHQQPNSELTEGSDNDLYTLVENTLNFNRTINKHNFSLLAGVTQENFDRREYEVSVTGLPNRDISVVGAASAVQSAAGRESHTIIRSLLGRLTYAYDGRYLLTASIRRDGSTKFRNNIWGTFPSASVGWNVSEESFMEDIPWLSTLKIRASYGRLGNSNTVGDYAYLAGLNFNANYTFGGEVYQGTALRRFPNDAVRWETVIQSDIGFNLGLFGDKLTLDADYYLKDTRDMLTEVPVPLSSGTSEAPTLNAATVRNKGFEVALNYQNTIGDFQYSIGGNLTTIDNEVTDLGGGRPFVAGRTEFGNVSRVAEGYPIGYFYTYVMDGIYQNESEIDPEFAPNAQPGDIRFRDVDGDGLLTEDDRTFTGSPIPDVIYGARLSAAYKGFDASVFFQGVLGNEIYSEMVIWWEGMYRNFNFSKKAYEEHWQPERPSTTVPRAIRGDPNGNASRPSTRMIFDGSYLRLKNVTIGYSLPTSLVERIGMDRVRFYATGQNLLTFTDYPGYDPEIGSNASGTQGTINTSRGIDNGYYPQARTVMLGVQVGF